MLLKSSASKKIICIAMVLVIVMSCAGLSVFAEDSKTVTKSVTYTVNVPSTVIENVVNGMKGGQISYNEGGYTGTLKAVSATVTSAVPSQYSGLITYTVVVVYSGVVTRPDLVMEKVVAKSNIYTVTIPESQLGNVTNGMAGGSISYNDGLYAGTLKARTVMVVNATPGSYGLTTYTIVVVYEGTVTLIQ